MKTSAAGIELITRFEGLQRAPYVCPAGWLTIGYGHVLLPEDGDIEFITKDQAVEFLKKDLERAEGYVNGCCSDLTQNEFDALVSFVFNVGVGAFRSSTLRLKLDAGDKAAAAEEFLKWNKGGGKVLPGLVARRKAEREMFLGE